MLTVLISGWWWMTPSEFEMLKSHTTWGLGFGANFKLNSEINYFDIRAELKPLLHLWSLAIEEQFYLIWPIILWLVFKKNLSLTLTTLILIFLSYFSKDLLQHTASQSFYFPWTRFWELQVGALLALFQASGSAFYRETIERSKIAPFFPFLQSFLSVLGFSAILFSVIYFDKNTSFPSNATLIPVIGTAIIILADKTALINATLLSFKPMRFIGLISYPLYLWHWPILSFQKIILGEPNNYQIAQAIALSITLAVMTYYFIEKKFRFESSRLTSRTTILIVSSITVMIGVQLTSSETRFSYSGFELIDRALLSAEFPTREMKRGRFSNGLKYYEIKTKNPKITLFLGDSHVVNYASRIQKVSNSHPDSNSSMWVTHIGCLPVRGYRRPQTPECDKLASIVDVVGEKKNIVRVVIGAHWSGYLDQDWAVQVTEDGFSLVGEEKIEARKVSIQNLVSDLKSKGIEVVLLLDTPHSSALDPRNMIKRKFLNFELDFPSIDKNKLIVNQGDSRIFITKIVAEMDIKYLDPLEYFCNEHSCPTRDSENRPIFRDSSHFTIYGSETYLDFIDRFVAG